MKTCFLLILWMPSIYGFAQPLDGAFKITAAQYGTSAMSQNDIDKQHIIKIFKDGYWIAAFFGDPQKPFDGTGGGTYTTEDGKYMETLHFYSWDSTAVGATYTFDYQLQGDKYLQDGFINSDKYQKFLIKEAFNKIVADAPLNDASLEGAWKLQSAEWGEQKSGEGNLKNVEQIKIYAYPRFAWARYNTKTKQFVGAGGGTYQYDGKKLVEHIEYITDAVALHTNLAIDVTKLSGGEMQQLSWNGYAKENWKKLSK